MKKQPLFRLAALVVAAIAVCAASCNKTPENPQTGNLKYAISVAPNNAQWGSVTAKIDKEPVSEAKAGETIKLAAVAETGYEFSRWEVAENAVTLENIPSMTFEMPEREVGITAVFAKITPKYKINKSALDDHATVTITVDGNEVEQAEEGAQVEISVEVDDGFAFDEWMLLATGSGNDLGDLLDNKTALQTSFEMPAREVTVAAMVSATTVDTYSVTIAGGENGTVTITTFEADGTTVDRSSTSRSLEGIIAGTAVKIEAIPDSGYDFTGWSNVAGYVLPAGAGPVLTFDMPGLNVSLTARFKAKQTRMLTLAPVENGSITATVGGVAISSGTAIEAGKTILLTANPTAENIYDFGGWSANPAVSVVFGNKNAPVTSFEMPGADVEVGAEFVPKTSVLSFSQPTGGSISVTVDEAPVASGSKVAWGATASIKATKSTGYKFVKWSGAATAPDHTPIFTDEYATETSFEMPHDDTTISAIFEPEITGDFVEIGGVKWATSNLAAPGKFAANETDAGLFYQWGVAVGFDQSENSTPAGVQMRDDAGMLAAVPVPNFATANPCPVGWRVPRQDGVGTIGGGNEFSGLMKNTIAKIDKIGSVPAVILTDRADPNKKLVFPLPGSFSGYLQGRFSSEGIWGRGLYWSQSAISGQQSAYGFIVDVANVTYSKWDESSNIFPLPWYFALSVRCVRE